MIVKCGIDLVYLPKFKTSLKRGGEGFLRRVFKEEELGNIQHLAGIFAAKEAVMKALSLPPGSWLDIQISYQKNGAPEAKIHNPPFIIHHSSLSLSHDKDYVVAQYVAILKK